MTQQKKQKAIDAAIREALDAGLIELVGVDEQGRTVYRGVEKHPYQQETP